MQDGAGMPEFRKTADGSPTLYSAAFGETYHSMQGALSESQYVFVEQGAKQCREQNSISILEYGLGIGLNFLASIQWALQEGITLHYTGIELYPVAEPLLLSLKIEAVAPQFAELWQEAMLAPWQRTGEDTAFGLPNGGSFRKLLGDMRTYTPEAECYQAVYFDAFSPEAVPEQWQPSVFQHCYDALRPGGLLVTYSASGVAKRGLRSLGFWVERLPGALGKRHMLRAKKPANHCSLEK